MNLVFFKIVVLSIQIKTKSTTRLAQLSFQNEWTLNSIIHLYSSSTSQISSKSFPLFFLVICTSNTQEQSKGPLSSIRVSFKFYQNVPVYKNYKWFSDKPSCNHPIIIYSVGCGSCTTRYCLFHPRVRICQAKLSPS